MRVMWWRPQLRALAAAALVAACLTLSLLRSFSGHGPAAALCQASLAPLRPASAPLALGVHVQEASKQQGFTIVVSTFRRDASLVENVGHWLTCGAVVQGVQIIWHDPDRRPPPAVVRLEADPRVRIVRQRSNRLTNRYRIDFDAAADAVFSVDDDVAIDCRLLSEAYKVWRPERMVGFAPRKLDIAADTWRRSVAFWDPGASGWTPEAGYDWYSACRRGFFPTCGYCERTALSLPPEYHQLTLSYTHPL